MDPLSVALLASAALYTVFHYLLDAGVWERAMIRRGMATDRAQANGVLLRRLSGGVFLGGGATVVLLLLGKTPAHHGLLGSDLGIGLLWAAGASLVLLPIVVLSARNPRIQAQYPEIRTQRLGPRIVMQSALAWAVYLLGYEFFFRGFLLFLAEDAWGVWPALAVTTALYTLAHLNKPAAEALSCLPMGLLFGAMAIDSNGIWGPYLLHLAIAVAGETAAARFNSEVVWWAADVPEILWPDSEQCDSSDLATAGSTTTPATSGPTPE